MILDTLAAMAATKNGTIDYNTSVEEIFDKLVELESRGLINFEYEVITIRGTSKLNAKMDEWKYFIKGILSRSMGMRQIEDSMLNELVYRIELYKQGILYPEDINLDIGLPAPFGTGDRYDFEPNYETSFPLNLRIDVEDERDYAFTYTPAPGKAWATPIAFDYSDEMTPVKNQGRVGSCVGFACVAMKEWQEIREYKAEKNKKTYAFKEQFKDLSEQWVYYMAKKIDPWPNQEGTSIRCAMTVLNKIGVPNESGWRYNDLIRGSPENWAHLIARWTVIKSYERITNINQLKQAIYVNGPVVIGMLCFNGIFYPDKNGVIPMPKKTDRILGGHAVCVVGYDDKKKLIKFKNSWGTGWGASGYGYLSYNYTPYIIDLWVAKDARVTFETLKNTNLLKRS